MENNNLTPVFQLSDFECGVNYALEASAGTGKTYSITEIVKKLVFEFHVGLDKILLVTYTEKAAGELKDRIREGLTSPMASLGGKSIAEALAGKVNCDVDNASIGTIHSFCKTTIDEFAISANQPTGLEMATGDALEGFAREYLRKGPILDDVTSLLVNCKKELTEGKILGKLEQAVKDYYLDKNYNEDPSIIVYKKTYEDEDLEILRLVQKLRDAPDLPSCLKQESPELFDKYLVLHRSANPYVQKAFESLTHFPSFLVDPRPSCQAFGILKKNQVSGEEIEAFDAFVKLKKCFGDFSPEDYLIDLYLKDFYKAYQAFKEKNRLQSFSDMIRVVRELVLDDKSKLLDLLRGKYQYGIIDEFQDTNQIQFDIFSKIFLCEGHNIIVVGDPKQSIYRFQSADVNVYQTAVNLIAESGKKCRLAKNWRSSVGVVQFGNALFPEYPFDTGFEPSEYCLLSKGDKERRAKFNGYYIPGVWLNKERLSPGDFANFAVEQILECTSYGEDGRTNLQLSYIDGNGEMKYRDCRFSDFVVLGKTKSEMPYLQNALKRAGIPVVRYKDDSLFKGIECAHWIAVLQAIDVPDFTGHNRGYFRKALFTRFFDLPLSEISKERYETDDTAEVALFTKWRSLAKAKLWQDLFDSVIVETKLESHMSSLSELQSLAAFKQIASFALDYLGEGNNLASLIALLKEAAAKDKDDDDGEGKALVARSTEFNCVTIMTMHASKGLQFPIVISVGGSKRPASSSALYKFHADKDGKNTLFLSLNKTKEVSNEEEAEFYRLFYVAYTRPEYLLILPRFEKAGLPKIDAKTETFLESYQGKTLTVDGRQVPYYELKDYKKTSILKLRDMSKAILAKNGASDEAEEKAEQEKTLKKLIREKGPKAAYKHSYSSLAHPNKEKEEDEILDDLAISDLEGDKEEQAVRVDESAKQVTGVYDPSALPLTIPEGYPKGAAMGNAIHEVFERLDFTDYGNSLEPIILDRFALAGFDLSAHPDWLAYTKGIVTRTLDAVLPKVKGNAVTNGTFRLSEIKDEDKKPEIEFNFNYPGQALRDYLTGFIDLLFRQGDVYCVLDWKSDTLSDEFPSYGDKDSLKGQVDRRYSIQRVLYCYCLIKWLKQHYGGSEEEVFASHFGGIYYVFVRGCTKDTSNGIYVQTWDSWANLEKEFLKIVGEGKE